MIKFQKIWQQSVQLLKNFTSATNEIIRSISNIAKVANDGSKNIAEAADLADNVAKMVEGSKTSFEEITRNIQELSFKKWPVLLRGSQTGVTDHSWT